MKKNTVLVLVISTLLMSVISCSKEEDPPDDGNNTVKEALAGGGFEEWEVISQGQASYENPAGGWWASLNMLAFIGGPVTVSKTVDAHAGNYAARLETKKWGETLTIPGILISGTFDRNLPMGENLIIGKPFSKRPASFRGYYKYTPAGSDSLVIFIALTRYTASSNSRDTIAQTEFVTGLHVQEYSPFELLLNYKNQSEPDSIHVILLSSIKGREMQGNEGSVLIVDELSLTYD